MYDMFHQSNDGLSQEQAVVASEQPALSISTQANLPISKMVTDVPLSKRTVTDIDEWRVQESERTRSRLTFMLMAAFVGVLTVSVIFTAVAAFNKNADKGMIQNELFLLIDTTSTLLAMAMGYYFGTQSQKK